MRRREFVTLVGGATAWPLAARAQRPKMPVIGVLESTSPDADRVHAFRQGLQEVGYADGENVTTEYRWARNQIDRLPAMAAELVRRQVAVIAATGGSQAAFAARAATTTLPIVFRVTQDPVSLGLVPSLARPGGNLTGVNSLVGELTAKRLELLRELVPGATRVAVLINPTTAPATETAETDVNTAARALGLQIQIFYVNTSRDIDTAFATFVRERPDALFVSVGALFTSRRVQLANLAARHAIPMASALREIAEAGGLMSYGTSLADSYRQVGAYVGRILKGTKPAELPVMQASKFELVINAQTARMLGLTLPPLLLTIADEVIE
jgi:ABC-type uncharacterized transport system substrate-binding protein